MQIPQVNDPTIITRLINRFNLILTSPVGALEFSPTIVPVTNVDLLKREIKTGGGALDCSGVAGGYVTGSDFTVPAGKRWYLQWAYRGGSTANCKMGMRPDGSSTVWISSLATTEANAPCYGILIKQGGSVGLYATGNGADNALTLVIAYEEENAY